MPVPLGSRALDILIVLAERAGEVVSQRELIARVWRDLVVTPSNLRVHVAGLRKALGDGDGRSRLVVNVPGQGYCFVAPVERRAAGAAVEAVWPAGPARHVLPGAPGRLVGRDDAVHTVVAELLEHRFLSIVGPGGMGKSMVAACAANTLSEAFADQVCFVDVGAIKDPARVPNTVASALGLTVEPADAIGSLATRLRPARILLVLDNCERVIEALAPLAERIFRDAPGMHLLATSREALRVEGERAYSLPPLATPPVGADLTAAQSLGFAAIELFVERAAANGADFEFADEDVPVVAGICRRLDGMPLAIELAAGQIGTHGLHETARLLAGRLGLLWRGRRTALPRHQSLRALMEWSYELLSDAERLLLSRLSNFAEPFTLADARAAAGNSSLTPSQVVVNLDNLVAKSLVLAEVDDGAMRFRMLETIRDYAAVMSRVRGENDLLRWQVPLRADSNIGKMSDLHHGNCFGMNAICFA